MLLRNIGLTTGLLFALAVGCGGKAVIDGTNNNTGGSGDGGSGGATTPNSSTSMVSSSTGMVSCDGVVECCQELCDTGAENGLACFAGANCGCPSLEGTPAACGDALAVLFACASVSEPFGYTCDAAGGRVLLCGVCQEERAAVDAACGPWPCQ